MDNEKDYLEESELTPPLGGRGADIELRSDEVQEILTRPPHSLIRYGITLIGIIILILLIGSFIFKYPEIIQGEVTVTTENPPVWLIAKSTGRIKELTCIDKQLVDTGKVLLTLENSAETKDVVQLINMLNTVQISDSIINIPNQITQTTFVLGEIQTSFSNFVKAIMNYNNMKSFNPSNDEKNNIIRQLEERKIYISNLNKQLDLKKRELELSASIYNREKSLYDSKVNSKYDLETNEQTFINKKQDLLQLNTNIALAEIENSQLQGSVKKLTTQQIQEKNQIITDLKSSYRELKTTLNNWEQNYVLISPQKGIVTFNSFWKQNQYVKAGDKVLAIVPENSGKFIGKIKLPVNGSGKVETGQMVNIKISGYPYMEFGILKGKIRNKSLVTNDNFYTLEVELTKGLRTTTGKDLKFTGELMGTAEIITEDRTLFERLYSPLKYLTNKALD